MFRQKPYWSFSSQLKLPSKTKAGNAPKELLSGKVGFPLYHSVTRDLWRLWSNLPMDSWTSDSWACGGKNVSLGLGKTYGFVEVFVLNITLLTLPYHSFCPAMPGKT